MKDIERRRRTQLDKDREEMEGKEEEKAMMSRMRERGRRVEERVELVAEFARARTAGNPGTEENYYKYDGGYDDFYYLRTTGSPQNEIDNYVYF